MPTVQHPVSDNQIELWVNLVNQMAALEGRAQLARDEANHATEKAMLAKLASDAYHQAMRGAYGVEEGTRSFLDPATKMFVVEYPDEDSDTNRPSQLAALALSDNPVVPSE